MTTLNQSFKQIATKVFGQADSINRMENIGDRISHLMRMAHMSDSDLARAVGVSSTAVGKWKIKAGGASIRSDNLAAVIAAMKARGVVVSHEWLATGRGDAPSSSDSKETRYRSSADEPARSVLVREPAAKYHPTLNPSDDVIMLPIFDGRGRMGRGGYRPDNDSVVSSIAVGRAWFDRRIGGHLREHVKLLPAFGDSMEPTLNSGDLLFVDTSITAAKFDAIYVLGRGDELMIKRIQRSPEGGELILLSDNKAYSQFKARQDEIQVIGVVVAAWKLQTFF